MAAVAADGTVVFVLERPAAAFGTGAAAGVVGRLQRQRGGVGGGRPGPGIITLYRNQCMKVFGGGGGGVL